MSTPDNFTVEPEQHPLPWQAPSLRLADSPDPAEDGASPPSEPVPTASHAPYAPGLGIRWTPPELADTPDPAEEETSPPSEPVPTAAHTSHAPGLAIRWTPPQLAGTPDPAEEETSPPSEPVPTASHAPHAPGLGIRWTPPELAGTPDPAEEETSPPSEPVPTASHAPHAPGLGIRWTPPELIEACGTAVRWLRRNGNVGTVAVTSTARGEGRTTVASGIAVAESYANGRHVVLIELDFEHPSFATHFGLDTGPGIVEILRDGVPIEECIQDPNDGTIGVITAGDTRGQVAQLFEQMRTSTILSDLDRRGDLAVADLPPLLPASAAASLTRLMGTTLLVVRAGAVPASRIRRAIDTLEKPPAVFLNAASSSIPRPVRALLGG